jgi:hypothetical protein
VCDRAVGEDRRLVGRIELRERVERFADGLRGWGPEPVVAVVDVGEQRRAGGAADVRVAARGGAWDLDRHDVETATQRVAFRYAPVEVTSVLT